MKSILLPGDVISYDEMCQQEGVKLQRGMNFRINGGKTVILTSARKDARYNDQIEEGGKILIYEGHDVPRSLTASPKNVDQPIHTPGGKLTQNGKFIEAATHYKEGFQEAELVHVYEKLHRGIWVFNGVFQLIDGWITKEGKRKVCKFKLQITDESLDTKQKVERELNTLDHNRIIPTSVKLEVWQRDKGKCVACGSADNLHFDHIVPFAKGGTSLKADNIQLLCARHNLAKSDRIE